MATRGQKSGKTVKKKIRRPFWRTSIPKTKKINKMENFRLVHTFFMCGLRFLIFGQEVPQKFKKLTKKGQKVGCTNSRAVRACAHVHAHKHYKSTQETPRKLSWKFREVSSWFGWETWRTNRDQNVTQNVTDGQTIKRTNKKSNNCQIYIRIITIHHLF